MTAVNHFGTARKSFWNRQIQIDKGFDCAKMHRETKGQGGGSLGDMVDAGLEATGPPDGLADETATEQRNSSGAQGLGCLVSRN